MSFPTRAHTFVAGDTLTASQLNTEFDIAINALSNGTKDANVSALSGVTLAISTTTDFTGNVNANANVNIGDSSSDTMKVNAISVFNNAVTINAAITLNAAANITGNANISGNVNAAGNVVIGGTLGVTGITTLTANIAGSPNVTGTLTAGNLATAGTSQATGTGTFGNVSTGGTLGVTGLSTLTGGATTPNIVLSSNIGTGTPTADKLYADLLPRAWAQTNTTAILDSKNLTLSVTGAGTYQYTFKTNMADANYAVLVTPTGVSSQSGRYARVQINNSATFTCFLSNASGDVLINTGHSVLVFGNQ